jgi:hypothetical protein
MSWFSLAISPNLPSRYVSNILHSQSVSTPDAGQYQYVSSDGYNIWPLVTGVASGQSGHSRIYFPETEPLLNGTTYQSVSAVAVVTLVSVLAIILLFSGRSVVPSGSYLAFVVAGTLGLLMLKTGVSVHHFVIALGLIPLLRKLVSGLSLVLVMLALTITTFISTYGSLGFALASSSVVQPLVQASGRVWMNLFMNLFVNDRFITVGIISNAVVLVITMAVALRSYRPGWPWVRGFKSDSVAAEGTKDTVRAGLSRDLERVPTSSD